MNIYKNRQIIKIMETKQINFKCGSVKDEFDMLTTLCEKEAHKLCSKLDIKPNSTVEVSFWTKDFPELICVGKFTADEDGNITFVLDYSETTL